jgi:hypothetical protein
MTPGLQRNNRDEPADDQTPDREEWKSFWDLLSPKEAAQYLTETYGAGAIDSASHCAETAQSDGRETDHQFWLTVLAHLQGSVS